MSTDPSLTIDEAILDVAHEQWQKVAMIIAKVVRQRDDEQYELIASRVVALVEDGRLEKQGDLSKWRYSEVRLPRRSSETLAIERKDKVTRSELVQSEIANLNDSIELLQQAKAKKPTWLPYLYELSVLLMDAKRWIEADTVLDELIGLSEQNDDAYFLDEARFRKILCLKQQGRENETHSLKASISPDATVFIGDKLYGTGDL